MSNLYYLLNDVPLRITKVNGKNREASVELRDRNNRPFVLPAPFVDKLPVIREPEQNTVWIYEPTGNPMVYHSGTFHHPDGNVSLPTFITHPNKFIPMQSEPRVVDEFHDQLQGLMDDYHCEIQFSWNDGQVEARMDLVDAEVYGHGPSVGTALEEIAVRMFGVENGDDKL